MTEQIFNDVISWQENTFGHATSLSKISHLAEELIELVADIREGSDNKRLEFADCFILLYGAAAMDGMTFQDICNAVSEKMEINKKRIWGAPDENGVVRHVKNQS